MATIPFKYRDMYYTFKATAFIRNGIELYKITDLADESGNPIPAAGYHKQEIFISNTAECLKPDRDTDHFIDPELIQSIIKALNVYLTCGGAISVFEIS